MVATLIFYHFHSYCRLLSTIMTLYYARNQSDLASVPRLLTAPIRIYSAIYLGDCRIIDPLRANELNL